MSNNIMEHLMEEFNKKRVEFTTRFGLLEFNRFEESIKAIEIEDLVERAKHILVLLESEFGRLSFDEAMMKWWDFRQYDLGDHAEKPLVSEIEGYDENFDWSRKSGLVLKQINYELECSIGYSDYMDNKD
jgi:hypothetical protein